ncbi:major facilitator superfamily domain-containing protein [Aspergillus alliaceus]|uniref:Major facilitator superfamily domain-containing protein n=1 Tax=Petromyces alliaceus TaxID=209559 RepID=A0A5N7C3B2_PETAA|nr:major facilitator superfamily domain-containing protein [Aspergillus alliaceus]
MTSPNVTIHGQTNLLPQWDRGGPAKHRPRPECSEYHQLGGDLVDDCKYHLPSTVRPAVRPSSADGGSTLSAVLLLAGAGILYHGSDLLGLAGIATGGINSLTMMIVSDIVTLQERGRYQGILGSCIDLGNTVRPFVSAAFTQRATWRGFFYLISPLMVVSCALSFFLLPSTMSKGKGLERIKLIDGWGLLTGSAGLICVLIPLSGGGSYFAWGSALLIAMLSVGGACTLAFLFVEAKVARLPMVPFSMFRTPAVVVILLQNFFFRYCYYAELYFLPIHFENVRGMTPLGAAALLTPMVVAQMIFFVGSGLYITRFSRYGEVIWAGFFCWSLYDSQNPLLTLSPNDPAANLRAGSGAGLLCLFDQGTSLAVIVISLIILGSGVGNVFQPCLVAIQAHSPSDLRAVVISNRNFFRALGGAVGLACCSLIQQTALQRALPSTLREIANNSYAVPSLDHFAATERHQIQSAYGDASQTVFISMVPFMGVCLVLCVFTRDRGLMRKEETAMATATAPRPPSDDNSQSSQGSEEPKKV